MEFNKDDLFYLCTMIEFVSRKTHNKSKDIVAALSDEDIEHELKVASVNHCLSFEQVCDEWIEEYNIKDGNFDNILSCKYAVPAVTAIGRVFQQLITDVLKNGNTIIGVIKAVYFSFISDEITNYNSGVYYSNPSYIYYSYMEGMLLD